jgi:hypothetical protein
MSIKIQATSITVHLAVKKNVYNLLSTTIKDLHHGHGIPNQPTGTGIVVQVFLKSCLSVKDVLLLLV